MKVGLFITNQHTLDTDMVGALEDQFVMVRHARDRGWDSLMSGQHYLNEGDNKQLQIVPLLARLAAEAGEMTLGVLSGAVARIEEHRRWWRRPSERLVIAHVGPQSPLAALVLGQHRHRRLVAVHTIAGKHVSADQLVEWAQQ